MSRKHLPHGLVALLALTHCRATSPPVPTATPTTLPTPEAPVAQSGEALVRAREAPAMPVCEAADALTAAALSPSVAARPSLARNGERGLVAFVTDPHGDGATKLNLLALGPEASALDEHGQPRGIVELADTGASPNHPVLAPLGDGYLLVWRAGTRASSQLHLRRLDAQGLPRGDGRTLGREGVLGAPALRVTGDHWTVAVARAERLADNAGDAGGAPWATQLDVITDDGTLRSTAAPDGARFDGAAPVFADTADGLRVYTTVARRGAVPGDERALVRLLDGDAPTMVARDLDHPTALDTPQGTLLAWRARMTRHDAGLRAVRIPRAGELDAPPITLATWRGAWELAPSLVPLGNGLVGALAVSTLADDTGASLNVSLLDEGGRYIGRAPILTGFPARTAEVAVAAAPTGARDASAWVAVDGLDANGSGPKLLLTRVTCDPARHVERLDVPPGTFVQDLSAPDAAAASLVRGAPEVSCNVRATGAFTPHRSGRDDATDGTSAAVALTATGAVLMAVTRATPDAAPKLMLSTLDAQSHLTPPRAVLQDVTRLLALEPVPAGALAVATRRVGAHEPGQYVLVRGAATTTGVLAPELVAVTSAVVSPETGTVYVVGETASGEVALAQVAFVAGRAAPAVTLARLRRGDAVADVLRQGNATHLLLTRPDGLGAEVAQLVARLVVNDNARPTAAERDARDVFADPLGHARATVLWLRVANGPALVYDERNVLRVARVVDGQVREARSVLELRPGGGDVRSWSWAGGTVRWVALATGDTEGTRSSMRALTLAALDDRGEVRGLTTRLPDDDDAIGPGTALGARGERIVTVYPHNERGGGMTWTWIDLTCSLPGGV